MLAFFRTSADAVFCSKPFRSKKQNFHRTIAPVAGNDNYTKTQRFTETIYTQRNHSTSASHSKPCSSSIRIPKSIAKSGFVTLNARGLIAVSGTDAPSFLQGLITANVIPSQDCSNQIARRYTPGFHLQYTAFLNPQGRLLQDAFLYTLPASSRIARIAFSSSEQSENTIAYLIEVENSQVSILLKWLRRYKLRSRVQIRHIDPSSLKVHFFWDEFDANSVVWRALDSRAVYTAPDPRNSHLGTRVISEEDISSDSSLASSESEYALRRYLYGLPEGPDELESGAALVHDSSLDKAGAVDFRKGCYIGQELVIRTQHTGVVRKRILPVILYSANDHLPHSPCNIREVYRPLKTNLLPHSEILRFNDDLKENIKSANGSSRKERRIGQWITGFGNIGIAAVRLEPMVGIGPGGKKIEGWKEDKFVVRNTKDNVSTTWGIKAIWPDHW